MQQTTRHSVLLVEANPSLRRMIALGLQHRGLTVMETDSLADFPLSGSALPDLLVLDIDGEAGNGHALVAQAEARPLLAALPLVMLAWEHPYAGSTRNGGTYQGLPSRAYLAKPFDTRALHDAIEELLFNRDEIKVASKQATYLATQHSSTAPSIWPLVTAIGLLLSVTGLMLQITVTAIGLLVVMAALLCWTLGTKHEPESVMV